VGVFIDVEYDVDILGARTHCVRICRKPRHDGRGAYDEEVLPVRFPCDSLDEDPEIDDVHVLRPPVANCRNILSLSFSPTSSVNGDALRRVSAVSPDSVIMRSNSLCSPISNCSQRSW